MVGVVKNLAFGIIHRVIFGLVDGLPILHTLQTKLTGYESNELRRRYTRHVYGTFNIKV